MKENNDKPNPEIISYQNLRRLIGWLALLLPVVSMCGYMFLGVHHFAVLDSISEYYYSIMRDYFVGTLSMVGIFLIAYKGYNDLEDWVFNGAAVLCWLIACFSMNPLYSAIGGVIPPDGGCTINVALTDTCFSQHSFTLLFYNKAMLIHRPWFSTIHFASATLLFIILGFVSFYLFTHTGRHRDRNAPPPTREKLRRNHIYRALGITIWVSLAIYAVVDRIVTNNPDGSMAKWLGDFPILFTVEWICLWCFGLSWLIKGEGVPPLNDKTKDTQSAVK